MSLLDSEVSGSVPCPVWMKSKIYKCPNRFPNMPNPDPFAHDVPVNLVVRCCSFEQHLHPGSPGLKAGYSAGRSLWRSPGTQPLVLLCLQPEGRGRQSVREWGEEERKTVPTARGWRASRRGPPASHLPGALNFSYYLT